jgi:hypothetical protein
MYIEIYLNGSSIVQEVIHLSNKVHIITRNKNGHLLCGHAYDYRFQTRQSYYL